MFQNTYSIHILDSKLENRWMTKLFVILWYVYQFRTKEEKKSSLIYDTLRCNKTKSNYDQQDHPKTIITGWVNLFGSLIVYVDIFNNIYQYFLIIPLLLWKATLLLVFNRVKYVLIPFHWYHVISFCKHLGHL